MKVPLVNFDTIKQSDHVIILGAGPSINHNIHRIKEIQKQYNSLVIAANYKFPIVSDYTVFVSKKVFRLQKHKVANRLIIGPSIQSGFWRRDKLVRDRIMKYQSSNIKPWKLKSIDIDENGYIGNDLCSSGFAALLLSVFCKPKQILIAGFDGRTYVNDDGYSLPYFNRSTRHLGESNELRQLDYRLKWYFNELLLPYIISRGITVFAFNNDPLRGVNKNGLISSGVKFID